MILNALFLLFALVLVAALLRPRWLRNPLGEGALVVAAVVIMLAAAARIAFPQENVDFDTWAELSRFRLRVASELFKQHRPLQYFLEYCLVRAFSIFHPDLRHLRAAFTIAALLAAFCVLVRTRRRLFGTSAIQYPLLVTLGFMLTAGGEFLVDSWNDHLPLAPFYLGGVACLLGFRARPSRAARITWLVFLAESLLHTAEPWLWAVGIAAVLVPRGWQSPKERRAWLLLLCGMCLVSVSILSVFPGGGAAAGGYLSQYTQSSFGREAARLYAHGFERGGVMTVRARLLFPMMALLLGVLFCQALWRRRLREWLWLILLAVALVFPLTYETLNPERYWTISLLWPLLGVTQLRRLQALLRLRRMKNGRYPQLVFAGSLLFVAAFVGAAFASMPRVYQARNVEHPYNQYGRELSRALDPRGGIYVASGPGDSFYLWMIYWYPGAVHALKPSENLQALLGSETRRPIYLNRSAGMNLSIRQKHAARVVFKHPGDLATYVFEYHEPKPIPVTRSAPAPTHNPAALGWE